MKESRIMAGAAQSDKTVADTSDDEIDLMELVRALWRGKWTIILFVVIAALAAVYYASQVAKPQYQSTVDLTINLRTNDDVDIGSVVSGVSTERTALNTELEIIRSSNILGQVVGQLDLMSDPEFNPALRTPSGPDLVIGYIKSLMPGSGNEPTEDLMPVDASLEGNSFDDSVSSAPRSAYDRTIRALRETLSAEIKRETYVFTISVTTGSPEKSEEIANTLADIYIEDQIAVKFEATEQAISWLSDRVSNLEQELKVKEDALKAALSETEMINPEALEGMNLQAKDLRDRLQDTRNQIAQAETRLTRLTELRDAEDYPAIVEMTGDQTLQRLLQAIQADNPEALEMFDQRLETIQIRTQANLERLRSQASALEASSGQLEGRIGQQSDDLVRIQQLQREVEAIRTLYETFLTRLKETTVQRGLQQADSRVLSDAVPGSKVAPRTSRILALSMVLAAMLGAGLVLIRNFMHNGFRTAEDLEAATGLLVMGQVPKMPIKARKDLLSYLSDKPTSPSAEAIRNLRTSILLSNIDSPPQVIMTTSALPGEGKTTAAISLAKNFAGLGKKVLLIEGDLRWRSFPQYFAVQDDAGLISALSAERPLSEIVFQDEALGVDVLMAEKSRINAADLYSSARFRDFIAEIRKLYDVIIIDTPPVLVVPDARVIGQYVDATIVLVAWDKTHRGQVTAALRDLASVNVNVAGLVLTQIDPKGMRRYGYGEKYGAYSNYGKDYYNAG